MPKNFWYGLDQSQIQGHWLVGGGLTLISMAVDKKVQYFLNSSLLHILLSEKSLKKFIFLAKYM